MSLACIDYLFPDCWSPVLESDRRLVADGTSSIHDFPLIGGGAQVYTTQALIIARLGSLYSFTEAIDDSGSGDPTTPANVALFNSIIQAITNEVNGYLAPIYPIPPRRRQTVSIFQVLTVDSNGVILTIQQPPFTYGLTGTFSVPRITPPPPNGYYFVAPTPQSSTIYATTGGNGTGATMNVTFTAGPNPPFSVATAALQAGGTGYVPYDVIGLTGGTSYLPAKVSAAALALCCHALYARRLAPSERNPFESEANLWRGTPANPGELVKIGRGEIELDSDYPRTVSPGAAWTERNRLNMNSL